MFWQLSTSDEWEMISAIWSRGSKPLGIKTAKWKDFNVYWESVYSCTRPLGTSYDWRDGLNKYLSFFLFEEFVFLFSTIEHYLKACAGKPDCREMKMNWVISLGHIHVRAVRFSYLHTSVVFNGMTPDTALFPYHILPDIHERGICIYYSGLFRTVDTVWSTFCNDLIGNYRTMKLHPLSEPLL